MHLGYLFQIHKKKSVVIKTYSEERKVLLTTLPKILLTFFFGFPSFFFKTLFDVSVEIDLTDYQEIPLNLKWNQIPEIRNNNFCYIWYELLSTVNFSVILSFKILTKYPVFLNNKAERVKNDLNLGLGEFFAMKYLYTIARYREP